MNVDGGMDLGFVVQYERDLVQPFLDLQLLAGDAKESWLAQAEAVAAGLILPELEAARLVRINGARYAARQSRNDLDGRYGDTGVVHYLSLKSRSWHRGGGGRAGYKKNKKQDSQAASEGQRHDGNSL